MAGVSHEILRANLVEAMQVKAALTPAVLEAFLHVPRDVFVSSFYERSTQGTTRWKQLHLTAVDEATWLTKIYSDQPLITHLDEHQFPASSSSQPSIMAMMLGALHLKKGDCVLEI